MNKTCGYCRQSVPGGKFPQEYSCIVTPGKSRTFVHKECLELWRMASSMSGPMAQSSFSGAMDPAPSNRR